MNLPHTAPLEEMADRAAAMVAGISAFLDRALAEADAAAASIPLPQTPEEHARSVRARRLELARIVGAVDQRVPAPALESAHPAATPAPLASTPAYDVYAVRWPVLPPLGSAGGVDGEGLLLEPRAPARANVVALPDADWSPEQLAGLAPLPPDAPAAAPLARRLAEAGCRVVVPQLIDRTDDWSGDPRIHLTNQPHREFVYRMAFQLGRHVIGYEVQKVLALVDSFTPATRDAPQDLDHAAGQRAPAPGQQGSPPTPNRQDPPLPVTPAAPGTPAAAEGAGSGRQPRLPLGVFGCGEGGLLALHAGALDPRIDAVAVAGHFRNRQEVWREPIYRNVWRLLRGFSDAELAAMIAPRTLVVEASAGPAVAGPPPARPGRRGGAAPGALAPPPVEQVRAEVARARRVYTALSAGDRLVLVEPATGNEPGSGPGTADAVAAFLNGLGLAAPAGAGSIQTARTAPIQTARTAPIQTARTAPIQTARTAPITPAPATAPATTAASAITADSAPPAPPEASPDLTTPTAAAGSFAANGARDGAPRARLRRQFEQLCRYTQGVLRDATRRREQLWAAADPSSLEAWQASCPPYREQLWREVIGRLPEPTLPPNPRTRVAYTRPSWTGYEVTLDLWPDVFASGVLLVPGDLAAGERRPVVVCQHGLEGRPQDLIEKEGGPYNQYAVELVERGYVVYAPQNPYIGQDRFRWLQRKANPLGWSLFSFIAAQHARTLDWLASLPFVDPDRIAFYGLSYGGKTAMRLPALLERYCLSICSGDFNEWIVKCASTDLPMSYLYTGEWEMFEFDLGNTFNYAEMAYLIAPRPFMVERGHRDGVALDEWVAFEYARVRRRYADLNIPERTEIAYFDGPHEIDGRATFPFLDRHLRL